MAKEKDMIGEPTIFCQETVTTANPPEKKPPVIKSPEKTAEEIDFERIKAMNIYGRMECIQNELSFVSKNLSVGTGNYAYKAVGETDILKSVIPLEKKYHIYSYPFSREIANEKELSQPNGKTSLYCKLETVYRFVNIDNPDEHVDIKSYGEGIDPADKGVGKAMTYADKYALMKAYKIRTGDDPDVTSSEDNTFEKSKESMATQQQIEIISQCEPDRVVRMLEYFHKDKIRDMTMYEASKAIKKLKGDK